MHICSRANTSNMYICQALVGGGDDGKNILHKLNNNNWKDPSCKQSQERGVFKCVQLLKFQQEMP